MTDVPAPDFAALGREVAKWRVERGMSIDKLAGETRLDRTTILYIEHGKKKARLDSIHTIAHVLNVPMETLVAALCTGHPPAGSGTTKKRSGRQERF